MRGIPIMVSTAVRKNYIIRESVDSLCRDGTDTPYTQYIVLWYSTVLSVAVPVEAT